MKKTVLLITLVLAGLGLVLLGGCGYPYPTSAFRPSNIGRTLRQSVEIEASLNSRLVVPYLIPESHMRVVARGDGIFIHVRAPFDTDALMNAYHEELRKQGLNNVTVTRDGRE